MAEIWVPGSWTNKHKIDQYATKPSKLSTANALCLCTVFEIIISGEFSCVSLSYVVSFIIALHCWTLRLKHFIAVALIVVNKIFKMNKPS